MNNIEIHLRDAEDGKVFSLKLSPADALRVQNDMVFATTLLNVARQANDNTAACFDTSEHTIPSCSSVCFSDNFSATEEMRDEVENTLLSEEIDGDLQEFSGENFRWSHAAVLFLIEEYRQHEKDMFSGKVSQKKTWEKIAKAMNERGYSVTGRQCCTRMNTMKRTYKAVKDHNNKSGNNKRTWQYFQVMESLLGDKPYMVPLSTMSSPGADNSKVDSSSSNLITGTTADTIDNNGNNVSRKRKADDVAKAILESRAIAEEGREKRHRERMESREQMMEKLDKILEKI